MATSFVRKVRSRLQKHTCFMMRSQNCSSSAKCFRQPKAAKDTGLGPLGGVAAASLAAVQIAHQNPFLHLISSRSSSLPFLKSNASHQQRTHQIEFELTFKLSSILTVRCDRRFDPTVGVVQYYLVEEASSRTKRDPATADSKLDVLLLFSSASCFNFGPSPSTLREKFKVAVGTSFSLQKG